MPLVEITRRAASQVEQAHSWWTRHRPDAPGAIVSSFAEACALLTRQPGIGSRSATAQFPDLRRLYLSRVRYHVYYRIEPDRVRIVAFWHASRGQGPAL